MAECGRTLGSEFGFRERNRPNPGLAGSQFGERNRLNLGSAGSEFREKTLVRVKIRVRA